ncbi:MAG: PP2C family serine/threonine-protein phosphatase [Gammaproteobacteria bacterium]
MMVVQTASDSLIGNREENQDRLSVVRRGDSVLAVVVDGMGGHEAGAEAAQTAVDTLQEAFSVAPLPIIDAQLFLASLLSQAHDKVVALGENRTLGAKPRATCVVALIQQDRACWAHIGDSRVYWLRAGKMLERTRDHSHVEILLQEGLITEDEFREHPLRNYVEYCLGGEPGEPTMTISRLKTLEADDQLLLCSDGLWSGIDDADIARALMQSDGEDSLQDQLASLMAKAVKACEPSADNTTAAVVHWQGSTSD